MSAPTAPPGPRTRSFRLRVFGCQMNFYDGELIRAGFLKRGWVETEDAQATLCIRALMMEIDAPGSSEALDQRLLRSRNEKPVTQWRFGRD